MKILLLATLAGFALISSTAAAGSFDEVLDSADRSESDRERDQTAKPAEVLALAGLEAGDKVFDLLGGGGYWSELMAAAVGEDGEVWLHSNAAYEPYVGEELRARTDGDRLAPIVRVHLKELDDLELPDGHFDQIFFSLGFHDIFYEDTGWVIDREDLFEQLRRALKPGGTLMVIDHRGVAGTGSAQAQTPHRIAEDFAQAWIEDHGFKLSSSSEVLANPDDDNIGSVFAPDIRRKSDRFVHVYRLGTAEMPEESGSPQWIYTLKPTRLEMVTEGPTEKEMKVITSHAAWLGRLAEAGTVRFFGRTQGAGEATFGIVVFEAPNEAAARAIMVADPAVNGELMSAELQSFKIVE